MNKHLTNDFEVMEEVLVGAHTELRGQLHGLAAVVLNDEHVFFLIALLVVYDSAMVGSSKRKGIEAFLFLLFIFFVRL